MAPETDNTLPPSSPKAAGPIDLSPEIASAVKKMPRDMVRCTRVTENTYRCNWWSPEVPTGGERGGVSFLAVTTFRVRQSQYLRATKTAAGGLLLEEIRPASAA